jgi:chorismate mutase
MDAGAHGPRLNERPAVGKPLPSCKRARTRAQASANGSRVSDAHSSDIADPVLAGYRCSIDNIDAALVHILAERFRITQAVGTYKAERGLPASDPARESQQIARLRSKAVEANLDPEFTEKFLRFIIDEVIRHHRQAQGG